MQGEHVLSADEIGNVNHLKPESSGEVKLTPETIVMCVNRGRETLRDMFDSRPYVIPPGHFTVEYGAAKHFQARAVVPGSRNPEANFQASFITIIGVTAPTADGFRVVKPVDDRREWPAFTDEECRAYGHAVEALDRASMVDPIERDVEVQDVAGSGNKGVIPASRISSAGATTNKRRATQISGSKAAKAMLANKGKPGRNEAIDTIRDQVAGHGADPDAGDDPDAD